MLGELKPPRRRRERTNKPVLDADIVAGNEMQKTAAENERNSALLLMTLQTNHRHGYGDYEIKKDEEK